jgi:hypothetical protein
VLWHPGFHSYYTDQRFASLKTLFGEERWQELFLEGQALPSAQVVSLAFEI